MEFTRFNIVAECNDGIESFIGHRATTDEAIALATEWYNAREQYGHRDTRVYDGVARDQIVVWQASVNLAPPVATVHEIRVSDGELAWFRIMSANRKIEELGKVKARLDRTCRKTVKDEQAETDRAREMMTQLDLIASLATEAKHLIRQALGE